MDGDNILGEIAAVSHACNGVVQKEYTTVDGATSLLQFRALIAAAIDDEFAKS